MENELSFEEQAQCLVDTHNLHLSEYNDLCDEYEIVGDGFIDAVEAYNVLSDQFQQSEKSTLMLVKEMASIKQELADNNEALPLLAKRDEKITELNELVKSLTSDLKSKDKSIASLKKDLSVSEKDLKSANANKAKALAKNKDLVTRNKKIIKDYNLESTATIKQLHTVYKNSKNEYLMVHPMKQSLNMNPKRAEDVVLLYTDKSGVYLSACLSEDNELVFSSFIKRDNDFTDTQLKKVDRNCIRASEEARAFAKKWLYKVNVTQPVHIKAEDLVCIVEEL